MYKRKIPASDYHYSWATSSLGDNYSVRSGRQKVFGYWPKDGVLIRNNKKGEAGSYYATQITASTIESAIVTGQGPKYTGVNNGAICRFCRFKYSYSRAD